MRSSRVDSKLAPVLAARAHGMRCAPTGTEAILWEALRGSRLGVGFRRQVPLGRFIADFACHQARLVVEVDGGYHQERARQDARRDRELGRLGYRVVRLPAEMVQHRLAEAVALVLAALHGE